MGYYEFLVKTTPDLGHIVVVAAADEAKAINKLQTSQPNYAIVGYRNITPGGLEAAMYTLKGVSIVNDVRLNANGEITEVLV